MGEAHIMQQHRINNAETAKQGQQKLAQQQQMTDLVEASKLPHVWVNCFTLQDGGPNQVRFVFSDQFNQGLRPVPRAAITMDLAMFRNMTEGCAKVLAQVDEAAAKAKQPEDVKSDTFVSLLRRVRNIIDQEADNRAAAGLKDTDYEHEPIDLLEAIDTILAKAGAPN